MAKLGESLRVRVKEKYPHPGKLGFRESRVLRDQIAISRFLTFVVTHVTRRFTMPISGAKRAIKNWHSDHSQCLVIVVMFPTQSPFHGAFRDWHFPSV
jgi:hypothetical protein